MGRLVDFKSTKTSKVRKQCRVRVLNPQIGDGVVDRENRVVILRIHRNIYLINADSLLATTIALGMSLPRSIDQDMAHGFSRC